MVASLQQAILERGKALAKEVSAVYEDKMAEVQAFKGQLDESLMPIIQVGVMYARIRMCFVL